MKYIKKIFNWIYDLYYTYLYKTFLWRIRYFYVSIKKLIYWFPVIFKDRDWDHTFILKLLYHKIKSIRLRYEHNEMFVGQDIEIKWLKLSEYLLDYVINNKSWEDDEENKHLNLKNIESIKKWPEQINISHHKCDLREEKAQDLFWKIISWRSKYWWD